MSPLKVLHGVTLSVACAVALPASADFMELPSTRLAAPQPTAAQAAASGGARELWRSSGHLELGYYAADGDRAHWQPARPIEAAVDVSPQRAGLEIRPRLVRALWLPLGLVLAAFVLSAVLLARKPPRAPQSLRPARARVPTGAQNSV
jgi:hypothetical protein